MTKRVLLTGASGFVGSHMLAHIMETTDWHVVCPVTFDHKGDSLRFEFDSYDPSRITVDYCDLRGGISLRLAARWGHIDFIVHAAAESHVDRSITHPVPFIEDNIKMTLRILEYARIVKPAAFLFVSTDEVYGPVEPGKVHDEWDPIIPSNPYAASKAACEAIVISYWRTYSVPAILTNCVNQLGQRQDIEKMLPLTISKVANDKSVPIHYDAKTGKPGSRCYIHSRSHADALLHILRNCPPAMFPDVDRPDRYNICGDTQYSNLELAEMVASFMDKPLKYDLVDAHSARPGHDPAYGLSPTKLASTGWVDPVPMRAALKRTVEWTLAHPEWLV